MEERTEFLRATKFTFEQRQEIEHVLEWLTDNPDEAAAYIVWLRDALEQCE
jgi:plasmid stabilization system protein ParE